MKFLDCPHLGKRPISEFVFGGNVDPEPANLEISPSKWAFEQDSRPMERTEWWYHEPSQIWFRVKRDTMSNRIIQVSDHD